MVVLAGVVVVLDDGDVVVLDDEVEGASVMGVAAGSDELLTDSPDSTAPGTLVAAWLQEDAMRQPQISHAIRIPRTHTTLQSSTALRPSLCGCSPLSAHSGAPNR